MKLNKKDLETLLSTIKHRAGMFPREDFITKLKACDKAYYMYDEQRAHAESDDIKDKIESRYAESGVPVVSPAVEAEVSFMDGLFLSDPKIFSVVSNNNTKELAKAVQAINQQHSTQTGWARQLLNFFRDCAKYNLGIMLADWESKQTYIPTLNVNNAQREITPTSWSGNRITRLDLYNTIFDHSVSPADLPEFGEFLGYFSAKTQTALIRDIENFRAVPADQGAIYNESSEMWKSKAVSTPPAIAYKELDAKEVIPAFIFDGDMKKDAKDWLGFAEVNATTDSKTPKSNSLYQVATFYLRLRPDIYGIDVPEANRLQIWKIVVVNGEYIVHVKRETNAHDLIPVGVCQPTEDSLGHNTLGMVLPLRALQKLAKQLKDRRLAGLDRSISDRALYDPNRVNGEHLKSEFSDAKIPVNQLGSEIPLDRAYLQIPYQDATGNLFNMELAFVQQSADDQSGINRASRGQFQKGNKTLEEYNDVMSNADAKQYTRARAIEVQALSKIKHIIKWNLVQYATDTLLVDPNTNEKIEFKETEIKKAVFEFKLTDGLNPASNFINPNEALGMYQILQLLSQQQQQRGEPSLDLTKLVAHMLLQGKNIDISQYESNVQPQAQGS